MSKKDRVDELLEQLQTVESDVLKEALEEELKEARNRRKEQIKAQFEQGRVILEVAVNKLRLIRKSEEEQKKKVIALDTAFTQFKKDGDWNAFIRAYHKA
jgi:hypothetical protein